MDDKEKLLFESFKALNYCIRSMEDAYLKHGYEFPNFGDASYVLVKLEDYFKEYS